MEAVKEKTETTKPTYREALKWLDIWGRVVKERVLSGDITALPSFGGAAGRGGDSSPSDPSAMMLTFADVETFLAQNATPRQKLLAAFIHVFGVEERITAVVWVFQDGTRSDPLPPTEPAPAQAVRPEAVIKRRETYDLRKFDWPQLDPVLLELKRDKEEFLAAEHRRLLRWLTRDKGLDPR